MKAQLFAAIILIACFSYACNQNQDASETSDIAFLNKQKHEGKSIDNISADSTGGQSPSSPRNKDSKQSSPNIDWDKKIIRTANLSIEVKDYKSYSNSLNLLVKRFGGYLANEQETKNTDRIENRIKIKVPVNQFQDLMTSINNSGEKIVDKQVSSEDVTTEVIDTKSRIEAKKKIRQRYIDLLQQAKTMAEILSIQAEINGVQEQIEMAQGRVQYLTHSSAYSTIDLYYFQILNPNIVNDKPTFANKMSEAFKGGWSVVKDTLVVLVTIWPLWLIVIAALFIYRGKKLAIK